MSKLLTTANKMLSNIGLSLNKMARKPSYPKSVSDILDNDMKFKSETIKALKKFKRLNPWKGNLGEIEQKFRTLNSDLSNIYKIKEPYLTFVKKCKYGSCYYSVGHLIILEKQVGNRYGVVTYLHEFCHSLGSEKTGNPYGEKYVCKWSINLFRKVFPKQYEELVPVGHLLCTKETAKKMQRKQPIIIK